MVLSCIDIALFDKVMIKQTPGDGCCRPGTTSSIFDYDGDGNFG